MTLDDAKAAVQSGRAFGAVYPDLTDELDRCDLREWFCTTPGVPVNPVRPGVKPEPTGQVCRNCQGSRLVRTGTCVTCSDCGENEGCG
jgi:hypothetical protein